MSTAHRSTKLTDAVVRKLPLTARGQYIVRDTTLKGFFVVVGKTTRTWAAQGDERAGKQRVRTRRTTFGRCGDVPAREARERAGEWLRKLRRGELLELSGNGSNGTHGPITLRAAWEDYRDHHLKPKIAEGTRSVRTLEAFEHDIEKHLADWLDLPLAVLGKDVLRVRNRHRELKETKGPVAADNCFRYFRAVFRHARRKMDRDLPHEPTDALDFERRESPKTALLPEEFPAWWAQLQALPNPIRREFHLVMLLSGSRPEAMSRARWEHFDQARRVLRFPDPKGGPRRAFDMPLSAAMLESLDRVREAGRMMHPQQAREWIFPSCDSACGHITNTQEPRSRLSKWGVDLRRTYRSIAQAVGVSGDDRRALMNHASSDVHDRYLDQALLLPRLLKAQEAISRRMMELLRGTRQPTIEARGA